MRWTILGLAACAACGGDEDGALLTIHAPTGPAGADRVEIVLASADAATMAMADQRVRLRSLATGPARYFRQRATAGVVDGVARLDGFAVRIERDASVVPDEAFVPFVLAYDPQMAVIGIGAVVDDAGAPVPVEIVKGKTQKYTVEMTALVDAQPDEAIAPGQSRTVACASARQGPTWRSGYAWQPAAGPQLRLLLPDVDADAMASDASSRPTDLDCDGREADDSDCDDLRPEIRSGAADKCDGIDSNCDGRTTIVTSCTPTTASCATGPNSGVQICEDVDMGHLGACQPDAVCACANNPAACVRCTLDFLSTGDPQKLSPCSPSVGALKMLACADGTPCRVGVGSVTGPWRVQIADKPDGNFGSEVTVSNALVFLRVKSESGTIATPAQPSVGTVNLVIGAFPNAAITPVDLELGADVPPGNTCLDIGNGNKAMRCVPAPL